MPRDETREASSDTDGPPRESRDGGPEDDGLPITRRQAVAGGGLLALLGVGGAAGWATRSGPQPSAGATRELTGSEARSLAEAHAPQLVFDDEERWFPTDPREYTSQQNGETVVDGFDAFDGYSRDLAANQGLPSPTVCYHALTYEDAPLAVVQYWWYAAFDQFTTNFHWHDWEVLHAFVDTRTDEPVLYVASAHSRSVPNNEYLDPVADRRATVLPELGSHSSGLSVDEKPARFDRLPGVDGLADVTNGALAAVLDLPAAYGLPRDEGLALPFLVPELDGAPVYEHERLPNVTREHLIAPELTVSSYGALPTPPVGLPTRQTGTVLAHDGAGDLPADVDYDLVPTADLDHIAEFTGRQLSFDFAVPGFIEDAISGHITSTGVPWDQPRYDDPLQDVSDRKHRRALADRYGTPTPTNGSSGGGGALGPVGAAGSTVLGRIRQLAPAPAAPTGQGVAFTDPSIEGVALLESDPVAVPTFRGVVAFQGVPAGEHRLTVNAAGLAPYAQPVSVASTAAVATAGVDGAVTMPPNRDAVKLRVDGEGADATLARIAIVDDFAGPIYDAPSEGRDAVYVHRSGAYTVDVTDESGALGSYRVDPGPGDDVITVGQPETGPAALAAYASEVLDTSRLQVDERAERTRTTPTPTAVAGEDPTPTTVAGEEPTPTATPAEELADRTPTPTASLEPTPTGTPGELTTVDDVVAELRAGADAAARAGERLRADERTGVEADFDRVARALERLATGLERIRDRLPAAVADAVEQRLELVATRLERAREDLAA